MGCLNSKAVAEKSKTHANSPSEAQRPNGGSPSGSRNAAGAKDGNRKGNDPTGKVNESSMEKGGPSSDASKTAQVSAEQFLRCILDGTERFIASLPDSVAVKQAVALTFTNSCAEVTRTKYRLKPEVVMELISSLAQQQKLSLIQSSVPLVEERDMDDGFSRILLAWYSNNPNFGKRISVEAGQVVLDTLYIRYVVNKPVTFEDILGFYVRWVSANRAAIEVFAKFVEGKEIMSTEQFGRFLRETQHLEVTDRQILEKYKYRFGGSIHRYNFVSYNGSVLTNNAVDPARTSDVWQDMTQSFTHYTVSCVRIEEEEDLRRAIADGTRAFVLNIKRGANGTLVAGTCELQVILDCIKKSGFLTNTYPIVLCLSPGTPMPIDVQDAVAHQITDTLDTMVAKGLMFEGATINDPKFSPGALRKKVLIMSYQSSLRPFIGFLVADMNREGLGVRVTDVMEGTPAAKGGVVKDDWLTHVNGETIRNKQYLREFLAKLNVGDEFTVKRENLDEIKIVVGGAIDPNDKGTSPALSTCAFFKYSNGANLKPWETVLLSGPQLVTTTLSRKELANHFAFCTVDSSKLTKEVPDPEGIAARLGIEFIDVDNSERCLAWVRGRFSDNGRCGYILKTDIENSKTPECCVNIIGGPRLQSCPPLATVKVMLHGAGSVRTTGSQITFSDCNQATVAVMDMKFESNGTERSFTSSFCPALLRPGFRALPAIPSGEERAQKRQFHGVYCFIK